MNYPLKLHHHAAREIVCYFLGHKWKQSPRVHTKYWDMEEEDIPYTVRRRSTNHLFENVAWWDVKCTRCRLKLFHGFADEVWYKDFWRGVVEFFSAFLYQAKELFLTPNETPLWKRMLVYLPMSLVNGVSDFWMIFSYDRLPNFPYYICMELYSSLYEWLHKGIDA